MKNLTIGILAVIVLVGGYFLLNNTNATPEDSGLATTTPTTQTTEDTTQTLDASIASAPSVVTDTDVAPSNSTAVVTGTVNPNGAPTAYWYEYGESVNLGSRTFSQAIGSGWSSIPSPGYITGLRANTSYYFHLRAQNAYGTVNGATYRFSTNSNPPPSGSAPTVKTLSASGISRTNANLSGDVTPNQASTQYWFEYGKTANLGSVTPLVSVGDGSAKMSASASFSNLSSGTKYYFRLNAQNQFGTVNGATLTFTTDGPALSVAPVVTTQVAGPVGKTSATLRGTVNPNGTRATYWFEYSTDSLLGSILLKTTSQKSAGSGTGTVSVEANVSGLQSGATYYYRIVAQNSGDTARGQLESFKTN